MWASKFFIWSALLWTLMSSFLLPVAGLYQYTAAELLWIRWRRPQASPLVLHQHPDIALPPRQRYIHRGSCRNQDNFTAIKSICSTSCRPSRTPRRTVDHHALTSLAQPANAAVNFGLFNIRSLTNKGRLIRRISSLTVSLIFSV